MNIKRNRLMTLLMWCGVGIMVLLVSWLIFTTSRADVFIARSSSPIMWLPSPGRNIVEDPDAPWGVRTEYGFTLEDHLDHDTYIAFYTVHHYIDVYLDGELLYNVSPSEHTKVIKTVGCRWTMVPLYHDDSGKDVKIVLTPAYKNVVDKPLEVFVGPALDIYKEELWADLPLLLISIMVVITGVIFVAMSIYSMIRFKQGLSVTGLGVSAIMLGVWRFTDVGFTPLIVRDRAIITYYICIFMLMLGIVPIARAISKHFNSVRRLIAEIYILTTVSVGIVQLLLQVFGVYDLRETITITHSLIVLGVCIIAALDYLERRNDKNSRKIGVFPVLCVVFATGDILLYYIIGTSTDLFISMLAFVLYILYIGFRTVSDFFEQRQALTERENQLAERERELANSRLMTMTGQIRAHFIFNTLNAISGMCKYDPEKADETVVRFSRFLRTNINIIEEDKPVPFASALRHLEDYLILEQIRFGDRIKFEKDIEVDDFLIPPLIIQPIVENAIKHGLNPKPEGGTILLRTRRIGDSIRISIIDDGAGYDTEKDVREGAVGLKNLRYRLEEMVGGKLIINSTPGIGTESTIIIPCMEEE